MHCMPEGREGRLTARMIPNARCNQAAVAGDTCHFSQATYGIFHEVNDELGQGRVELAVGERQLFSCCDADVDSGMTRTGGGGELL